ncbi:Cytochrome P450 71D8 [Hordeum vulgare]|nr:Cytochrome P450 71D8 [Hordeum vulgare]
MAKKPSLASVIVDGLTADVQAAAEAVVAAPLEFDVEAVDQAPGEALQLDTFNPTLSASASEFGQYNWATPTTALAQRASLCIVKELGLLGPREKVTAEVAKALLHRFDEPLMDSDITVIAKLIRLDGEALRVMDRMADTEGVAEEAAV